MPIRIWNTTRHKSLLSILILILLASQCLGTGVDEEPGEIPRPDPNIDRARLDDLAAKKLTPTDDADRLNIFFAFQYEGSQKYQGPGADYEQAIRDLESALDFGSGAITAKCHLVLALCNRKLCLQSTRGEERFSHLLEKWTHHALEAKRLSGGTTGSLELANAYLLDKQNKRAITILKEYGRKEKDEIKRKQALIGIAIAYLNQSKFQEADDQFNVLLEDIKSTQHDLTNEQKKLRDDIRIWQTETRPAIEEMIRTRKLIAVGLVLLGVLGLVVFLVYIMRRSWNEKARIVVIAGSFTICGTLVSAGCSLFLGVLGLIN